MRGPWSGVRRGVAMILALAAAGCINDGGLRLVSPVSDVPVARAFMMPPPGGPAIVAVLERRYGNGLAQDIVLENNTALAQQNALYVRAFGPMGRDAGEGSLGPDVPSLAVIRSELRSRFPGVPMKVSGLYAQNRYGALGYATGRGRGSNCIYVWQRIAAEPSLLRFEVGAITWRLRLCDPHTSVRDLLLIAYGVTVTGAFRSQRWNPFGEPPGPDPRIGKPGAVILPQEVVVRTEVSPQPFGKAPASRRRAAPRRTARASRPAAKRAPAAPLALNRPAPGAAVVPRPHDTDLDEPTVRGSGPPASANRQPATSPAPQRAGSGDGGRSGDGAPAVRIITPTQAPAAPPMPVEVP